MNTIDLVIEELAEIKAQLLEMSLNHEQISGLTFLKSLKYDPMPGISNFSIFSKGKSLMFVLMLLPIICTVL